MKGTEKQIAWAEQIKSEILDGNVAVAGLRRELEKTTASRDRRVASGKSIGTTTEAQIVDITNMIASIELIDDAAWFIDNRGLFNGTTPRHLVAEAVTGEPSQLGAIYRKAVA